MQKQNWRQKKATQCFHWDFCRIYPAWSSALSALMGSERLLQLWTWGTASRQSWRRIFAGDQKSGEKKTLPDRTNPQIYNPNSNHGDVQLLSKKKTFLPDKGNVCNLGFHPLHERRFLSVNLEFRSHSSMKALFKHMLDPFPISMLKKKKPSSTPSEK